MSDRLPSARETAEAIEAYIGGHFLDGWDAELIVSLAFEFVAKGRITGESLPWSARVRENQQ